MKKSILLIVALVGAVQILSAVPARPGKFTKTLPDGRKVTLELHGDEFRHWLTDASGQVVKEDGRGFIVPSSMAEVEVLLGGGTEVNRSRLERVEQTRRMMRRGAPTRSSAPELHFPMILVQFPDLPFSVAETDEQVLKAFNDLANQVGYGVNGATGSIHDYFVDNSLGQTDFHFDVFGPVTVSQPYAYYGTKTTGPSGSYYEPAAEALMEAARILAEEKGYDIFNAYDNDGDGWVDAVFMFYAGFNEAEGGGEETIWPHEWSVGAWDRAYRNDEEWKFGNVRFGTYSCASEKRGNPNYDKGMCGIGTAVHEFGHAIGLPDLYDTNYDNYGDGRCGAVYTFSPMCNGSSLNDGRTPAYFTMQERIMMGWADGFTQLPASGVITIPSVDTNFAYVEETDNPGEYFVFESRSGKGWDAYVPEGLVVYHVDQSDNEVRVYSGTGQYTLVTAAAIWAGYRANINTWIGHPCYYAVAAADQESLNYPNDREDIPFPGNKGVTSYQWQGWDPANRQGDVLYSIAFDKATGTVTMRRDGVDTGITGKVTDTEGAPVSGATVRVYAGYLPEGTAVHAPAASAGGPVKIAAHVGEPIGTGETDAEGNYLVDVEGAEVSGDVTVEVSAPGFISRTEQVALRQRAVVGQSFSLMRIGQPTYSTLMKYDGVTGVARLGFGITDAITQMGAIRYSAEELAPFAGLKVKALEFAFFLGTEETMSGVKGIIDFGSDRVLSKNLPSYVVGSWNTLDLSGEDIRIPVDTDCTFGYALLACTSGYPHYYSRQDPVEGGVLMCYENGADVLNNVIWWDYSSGWGPLLVDVVLEDGTVLSFNHIANPNAGTYAVGSKLDLNLVRVPADQEPSADIAWYYDDEPVSESVTFSKPGRHILEARYTTASGRRKVIEMEIMVQ